MKKKVWIEQEIEVDISAEDMVAAICELDELDRLRVSLKGISHCIVFLREIPDELLKKIHENERRNIALALEKLIGQYKP